MVEASIIGLAVAVSLVGAAFIALLVLYVENTPDSTPTPTVPDTLNFSPVGRADAPEESIDNFGFYVELNSDALSGVAAGTTSDGLIGRPYFIRVVPNTTTIENLGPVLEDANELLVSATTSRLINQPFLDITVRNSATAVLKRIAYQYEFTTKTWEKVGEDEVGDILTYSFALVSSVPYRCSRITNGATVTLRFDGFDFNLQAWVHEQSQLVTNDFGSGCFVTAGSDVGTFLHLVTDDNGTATSVGITPWTLSPETTVPPFRWISDGSFAYLWDGSEPSTDPTTFGSIACTSTGSQVFADHILSEGSSVQTMSAFYRKQTFNTNSQYPIQTSIGFRSEFQPLPGSGYQPSPNVISSGFSEFMSTELTSASQGKYIVYRTVSPSTSASVTNFQIASGGAGELSGNPATISFSLSANIDRALVSRIRPAIVLLSGKASVIGTDGGSLVMFQTPN